MEGRKWKAVLFEASQPVGLIDKVTGQALEDQRHSGPDDLSGKRWRRVGEWREGAKGVTEGAIEGGG